MFNEPIWFEEVILCITKLVKNFSVYQLLLYKLSSGNASREKVRKREVGAR